MLGVFCLLLVAASIFFAMMSNGTCIHDGKIVSISNLGLGDDPDQFQPLDENHRQLSLEHIFLFHDSNFGYYIASIFFVMISNEQRR